MYVQETLMAAASVLAGFYGLLSLFRYLRRRRKQRSPGPVGYPFFGILSQIGKFNVIHKTLTAIGKRYGRSFQFELVGKKVVVLRSASIVQKAFNDASLLDRKETFFQQYVFNGKGFAFANYKNYVPELRNVFHKAMYWHRSMRDKHDETLLKETDFAVKQLVGEMSQNFSPDPVIKDLMTKIFSIEVVFDFEEAGGLCGRMLKIADVPLCCWFESLSEGREEAILLVP